MKKYLYSYLIAILTASLGMMSCGGGSSSTNTATGDNSGVTSVSNLPSATAAVTDGSDSSVSASLTRGLGSSETGMPMRGLSSDDFAGTSKAACESYNMIKTAINQAAQGDLIQCYITSTFDSFAEGEGIDIYDGEYHVFALDFTGSSFEEGEEEEEEDAGGGPSLIKFKIDRNSAGEITSFEMFACGDNGDSDEQSMYLLQTIDGNDFNMRTKNIGGFGNEVFYDSVTVSGTLSNGAFVDNLNGELTPKVIRMQHQLENPDFGFDFWGDMTVTQYADEATISGDMEGSDSFSDSSCTFGNSMYGSLSLVNTDSDTPLSFEMRDGAALTQHSGSCVGDDFSDSWDETNTYAWEGITALDLDDASESVFHEDVVDADLPELSEPSISFDEDETYDCDSSEVEATVVFADLGIDVNEACSDLELGHQHINCWLNDQEEGEEEE